VPSMSCPSCLVLAMASHVIAMAVVGEPRSDHVFNEMSRIGKGLCTDYNLYWVDVIVAQPKFLSM
jgi:hypothetical protein